MNNILKKAHGKKIKRFKRLKQKMENIPGLEEVYPLTESEEREIVQELCDKSEQEVFLNNNIISNIHLFD